MKLAFVNFYSGLADRGGETYVDSLATNLSSKHEVTVFQAGPKNGKKKYSVQSIKVKYDPLHPHSSLPVTHPLKRLFLDYSHRKELQFTIKLLPKLWKLKPDVIFPQNSGWEVLLLRMFSTIINAKTVVAGQSGPGWNDKVNLYIHPDCFIALTQSQADWAKKVTPWNNQKIVVIPNGVDLEKFSPKGERRLTNLSHPIVLAVGAAIKSKRIISTIKAVASLKNTSLLVAGTGPLEQEEDSLGKSLLGSRYQRLKVSHTDMPGIFRSSDVFTLCSDSSEAFGIVYLEALATGLPCVVTDDKSRREILEQAGIFVKNPEDTKEYSAKIKEALKQKSSDKYLKQADKYSWNKIACAYEKVLKML
ncbi:MAG TPA: glycosyltransferase family 4 protein [Candidatus Woesebacteria bacterium]|nr:glycosyltransferase family 4 protein [Candidatus Woesebacteria bacterium]